MNSLDQVMPSAQCEVKDVCYVDTVVGNLQRRKQRAELDLANINAALEALNQHPEVAKVLELISKAR